MASEKSFNKRYRAIHCAIWNDDKFPFCSEDAQAVFFHILTSPMSGPFGLFKAGIGALSDERRWDPARYRNALGECVTNGFVRFDETNLVIWVPNVIRYNPPASPNAIVAWGRAAQAIPDSPLKAEAYQAVKGLCDALGHTFPDAFQKGFGDGYGYPETRDQGPVTRDQLNAPAREKGVGKSVDGHGYVEGEQRIGSEAIP